MLNSTRTTSTPTAPSIPTFTPHSVDSSTPSSSGGLNTLRRIKRALERQESKSRSGLYPDLATKENIDGSARPESSCSIESGRYKKKSLQIKTNLGETESAVASCRQTSFDLNSLLNSKPNEYTRALQRIESIKRTAFSVTGNSQAFPAIKSCRVNTCEARIEDPCEVYNALAPKSVPSKKQITVEPVKVQEEEPVKVQTSGFSTVKEGTPEKESEEAKYKEKIAKLSKENRELKRKLNKQEQEHNAKLEEIKAKYENEIEELKNEIEKRVLENNQESEIVIETTKGQLDDEIARNEILRRQIIDLEANASELKDNLQKTQDEKAEIMKEIEQLKETYEARISEIQESHIEGELASAVLFFQYKTYKIVRNQRIEATIRSDEESEQGENTGDRRLYRQRD
eukprot:TRINITY_DN727_c0_g1_i1.p9 TRINITY_DN727_c0_g1~~TRINITY_DN727_c0_g1_i1.p9  ORF type:complete len:400 (-),score=67.59 TRINITY_DN727_c0_g1_i1:7047-8246(-)